MSYELHLPLIEQIVMFEILIKLIHIITVPHFIGNIQSKILHHEYGDHIVKICVGVVSLNQRSGFDINEKC